MREDNTNTRSTGKETSFTGYRFDDGIAKDVFARTKYDDKPGPSVEVRLMEDEMGSWIAPLPFRGEVKDLPNSREEAYGDFNIREKPWNGSQK